MAQGWASQELRRVESESKTWPAWMQASVASQQGRKTSASTPPAPPSGAKKQ